MSSADTCMALDHVSYFVQCPIMVMGRKICDTEMNELSEVCGACRQVTGPSWQYTYIM